MRNFGRTIPVALAIAFGLLTLLGLLFAPVLADSLTTWATFLAAVALVLGVINLLAVHFRRLRERNGYSGVLIISMLLVLALAASDYFGLTDNGVDDAFNIIQAPLEAAMASLLAFFLLFAGIRMLRRQRNGWAVLFIVTVVILLLKQTLLPQAVSGVVDVLGNFISDLIVSAGMRGLLIGVALGAIVVALRILTGSERPYNK